MIKISYDDIMMQASGEYLTENFPDAFLVWDEEDILEFIEDHAWEPLEYERASKIYSMIEASADSLAAFLEKHGVKVTGR